jgi:hypothetical protein
VAILETKYIKKSSSNMERNYRWMVNNNNINYKISNKINQSVSSKKKVINQRAATISNQQINLPKPPMSISTLTLMQTLPLHHSSHSKPNSQTMLGTHMVSCLQNEIL